MSPVPEKKTFQNQQGIGIIGIIIILAFVYAGLTAYSYFYPSFQLARYTPTALLNKAQDDQRIKDLEKIAQALDSYYDENRELPGQVDFCGRIVTVLYPTAKDALSPYFPEGIPQDPEHAGTHKDYFYRREDKDSYILLAVLDNPPTSETYNFEGCHDWPGDGVYNYIIKNDQELVVGDQWLVVGGIISHYLVDQAKRAVVSAPANISEGFSRYRLQESVYFYRNSRSSLSELKSHFYLSFDLKYIDNNIFDEITKEIDVINRMVNGLISSTRIHRTKP